MDAWEPPPAFLSEVHTLGGCSLPDQGRGSPGFAPSCVGLSGRLKPGVRAGSLQTLRGPPSLPPVLPPPDGELRKPTDLLHSSPTLSYSLPTLKPRKGSVSSGVCPWEASEPQTWDRSGMGWGMGEGNFLVRFHSPAQKAHVSQRPLILPSGLGEDGHPCHVPSGVLLAYLYKVALPLSGV